MALIHTFLNNSIVVAQAAPATPSIMETLFPMILLMVGFWFLIIGPQRKKQKKHQQMLTELNSGDEVITSGGIYGTITNVKSDRFILKVADGVRMEITKGSVGSLVSETEKDADKGDKK